MHVLTWWPRHPPIGTVGLTEPQARKKYGDDAIKICASFPSFSPCPSLLLTFFITDKSSFRALYFSMVDEEHKEPTVYKLICAGPEEKVVGVHILGLGSDEVMQGFGVAVKMGGMFLALTGCYFGVESCMVFSDEGGFG